MTCQCGHSREEHTRMVGGELGACKWASCNCSDFTPADSQPECPTCGGSGVVPPSGQTPENFQYGGPCPDCSQSDQPAGGEASFAAIFERAEQTVEYWKEMHALSDEEFKLCAAECKRLEESIATLERDKAELLAELSTFKEAK